MRHAICAALLLSACATSDLAHHEAADRQAVAPIARPERANELPVLASAGVGRPMEALGIVDVHLEPGRQDEALAELRARARAMGADAVVGAEFHHGEGGAEPTHVSGLAVRFRDLLQGRRYDVIAELEASAPMGRAEEAHAELRRQAGSVGADLILNVRFHHGEGADSTVRVTGKAIRIRSGI